MLWLLESFCQHSKELLKQSRRFFNLLVVAQWTIVWSIFSAFWSVKTLARFACPYVNASKNTLLERKKQNPNQNKQKPPQQNKNKKPHTVGNCWWFHLPGQLCLYSPRWKTGNNIWNNTTHFKTYFESEVPKQFLSRNKY